MITARGVIFLLATLYTPSLDPSSCLFSGIRGCYSNQSVKLIIHVSRIPRSIICDDLISSPVRPVGWSVGCGEFYVYILIQALILYLKYDFRGSAIDK
jgi:hypothetical protein